MAFVNPCGGLAWEMQDDGLIGIQGQGTPSFAPGSIQFQQMAQTWANWGNLILRASSATGVPASWILAIMVEETGLWSDDAAEQAGKVSSAGARGLMQVMPQTAKGFGADPDDMFDPKENIRVGAELLAKLANLQDGQLPMMAASYNSGRPCDAGRNEFNLAMAPGYATNVVRWSNTALLNLDLSPRYGRTILGLAVGGAGLFTAAVIAGFAAKPKFLRRFA